MIKNSPITGGVFNWSSGQDAVGGWNDVAYEEYYRECLDRRGYFVITSQK
jgi:hypothetical protein